MLDILLLLTSAVTFISSQTVNYRLPDTVKPISYDILISTDFETFNGTVSIELQALRPTASITLHMKDLRLFDVSFIRQPPGSNIEIDGFSSMSQTDFFSINLSGFMIANVSYILALNFSGDLKSEDHVGFYKSVYRDENDQPRMMATTNFKPTYARRAFPCFDQPDFKARFKVRLVRDRSLRSTSNMFIESALPWEIDNNKTLDVYAFTPVMSTYLVVFTISDYERIYNETYSVFGKKQLLDGGEGEYALKTGGGAIDVMRAYTGFNYSLLKLDHFALPNEYYKFDATENWGMITYGERYLMYHADTSTTAEKQTTATTVAHAVAHQWFGNLVTHQWWKHIWLNEGFATYLSLIIVDQLEPMWMMTDKFLTLILQPAFYDDAISTTITMTKDVESPSEIENLLCDTIVYNKAASIIRMTQAFLGDSVFKSGLTKYLNNWNFENVEPVNLYTSWQEAFGSDRLNVTEFLQIWETQKGYPVVTIQRNYDAGTITFSQKKFLLTEPLDTPNLRWPIPFNFMHSIKDNFDFSSTLPDVWLTSLSTTFIDESPESFVIANKGVTGYYRVNYDVINWNNIIVFLTEDEFSKILIVNRAQLLDDAFNLARAGELTYEIALQLSTYLIRERENVPLTSFLNAAKYLKTMLASYNEYLYFKVYIERLLTLISLELNFEDATPDSQNQRLNRINVMKWMCDVAGGECRQNSLQYFRQWKSGIRFLKPDSQLYIYCGALREGDQSDWDFLFKKYQVDTSDKHRSRILNALGCSENFEILTRLLDMTLDPEVEFFKTADRQTAFASVYSSGGIGLNIVLNYVKSRYTNINASTLSLSTIITGLSNRLSTPDQLTEFIQLLESVSTIVPEGISAAARKNVEDNVYWSSTNIPVISAWLKEYLGITTEPTTESTTSSETTSEESTSISVPFDTTPGGGTIVDLSFTLSLLCLFVNMALIKYIVEEY